MKIVSIFIASKRNWARKLSQYQRSSIQRSMWPAHQTIHSAAATMRVSSASKRPTPPHHIQHPHSKCKTKQSKKHFIYQRNISTYIQSIHPIQTNKTSKIDIHRNNASKIESESMNQYQFKSINR